MGGCEVKMDVLAALEPAVVFGLVSVEIVEHDMQFAVRIGGHDAVHESQELDAAAALLVGGDDLSSRHLEGGEQRGGAVPGVVVGLAAKCPPVGSNSNDR